MDLTRTTDPIQSRSVFSSQNTASHDLSKPVTNLSKFKGYAQPWGRANAGQAPDQYALNRLKSTDTLPSSLITRMAKGVLATQRRRLASQPSSSQDTHVAEHYKASYVLEDRGGATAPGAALSLRPTGKAAGGMDNPTTMTKQELRVALHEIRGDIKLAQQEYQKQMRLAENTEGAERQNRISLANTMQAEVLEFQRQYDSICTELEARSAGAGGSSGGPRF